MIYYMIRHRATGEFMPELKRTRGYSHWNPARESTELRFNKKKLLGTPRLFRSIRHANAAISAWNANPNGTAKGYQSHDGEWDEEISSKEDGRKKEDLQIVIISIFETGVVS